MRLTDLNPAYVGHGGEGVFRTSDGSPIPFRDRIGVRFDCPCGKCGTHVVILFNNPPDGGPCCDATQNHWTRTGDSFENMSLTPSILRKQKDCDWHGFVTNGEISTCGK